MPAFPAESAARAVCSPWEHTMLGAGRKGSWSGWGLGGEMQVGTLQAEGPIRSGGGRGASVWCVQGLSSGVLGGP